ncbi:MAG TPA: hypothetical protein VMW65_03570 [Chloroflexota bacterium]|nr:hypothetical protein [Chloroflexota bacterium]
MAAGATVGADAAAVGCAELVELAAVGAAVGAALALVAPLVLLAVVACGGGGGAAHAANKGTPTAVAEPTTTFMKCRRVAGALRQEPLMVSTPQCIHFYLIPDLWFREVAPGRAGRDTRLGSLF